MVSERQNLKKLINIYQEIMLNMKVMCYYKITRR